MKDYSLTSDSASRFITNYKKKDNVIYVTFANNEVWEVEATYENEQRILQEMKDQVEKVAPKKEAKIKSGKLIKIGVGTVCVLAGVYAGATVNDPMISHTVYTLATIGTLVPTFQIVKGESILKDIEKQKFILRNQEELNQGIKNKAILSGTSSKLQKFVQTRNNPFDLHTADNISLADLKKIKENLEKDAYFGFTYPDTNEKKKTI